MKLVRESTILCRKKIKMGFAIFNRGISFEDAIENRETRLKT